VWQELYNGRRIVFIRQRTFRAEVIYPTQIQFIMNTQNTYGDPSPIQEMLSGPFTLIDIGDSITDRQALEWMGMFPGAVPFGGYILPGIAATGQNNGGAFADGAFGTTALMATGNYSLFQAKEKTFDGTAYGDNVNAAWNRFFYNTAATAYQASSTPNRASGNYGGQLDWLAGYSFTRQSIYYTDGTPLTFLQDGCYRDSDKAGYNAFATAILNATGFTRITTPCAALPVATADDVYFVSRIANSGAPAAGQRLALCCQWIQRNDPSWVYGSMAVGGTILDNFLDPARITPAAWSMLSLIGATHVRIQLGQNENDSLTQSQYVSKLLSLISLVRSAGADIGIILVSQYQTQFATPAKLTTLASAMRLVAQSLRRVAFIDMNAQFPAYAPIAQYLADGTHPSPAGCTFFRAAEISLMLSMASSAIRVVAGHYATQTDLDDVFGRANLVAWAEVDPSGILDLPRIQRALDYADATIDDYFRDGPYASPLVLGASKATVATWAATIAGIRLYRSRTSAGTGGGAMPVSASVSIPGGIAVSASAGQIVDPYAGLLTEIFAQMARCKAGAYRLDASPSLATETTAASLAG
jgi:hypothetical protein